MEWYNKFAYAFNGIKLALKQKSIRIQLFLGFIACVCYYVIDISYFEWLVFILTFGFVIIAEWLNSVIEEIVDYISLERNIKAKIMKDMAAGLVLVACLFALIIGFMILFNNI